MLSKIACVIPARGGSKGVPRKNIKLLGHLPLLAYTIGAAKAAGFSASNIVVSTEDAEIASVARQCGSRVINRPEELADDKTMSEAVLQHALKMLEKDGDHFDGVFLLSPTNPFRDPSCIRYAVENFRDGKFDTIVGLVPIYKYQYRPEGASAIPLFQKRKNRQERTPVWLENGALYLSSAYLIRSGKIFGEKIGYIAMDELSSINIDSPIDFHHAEAVVRSGAASHLPQLSYRIE